MVTHQTGGTQVSWFVQIVNAANVPKRVNFGMRHMWVRRAGECTLELEVSCREKGDDCRFIVHRLIPVTDIEKNYIAPAR